jgi:hypothetical protein
MIPAKWLTSSVSSGARHEGHLSGRPNASSSSDYAHEAAKFQLGPPGREQPRLAGRPMLHTF